MADLKIDKSMTGFTKYEDKNGNGKLDPGETVGSIMYTQGQDGKAKSVRFNNLSVFTPKEMSEDLANRGDISNEASSDTLPTDDKGNFKIKNYKRYSVNAFKDALTKITNSETTNTTTIPGKTSEEVNKPKVIFDVPRYNDYMSKYPELYANATSVSLESGAGFNIMDPTTENTLKALHNEVEQCFSIARSGANTTDPGKSTSASTTPKRTFVEDTDADTSKAAPTPVTTYTPNATTTRPIKRKVVQAIPSDGSKDCKSTYIVQPDQSINELVIMSLKAENQDLADYKPTKREIARARAEFVKENARYIRTSKCSRNQFILVGSEIKMDCDLKKPNHYLDTKEEAEDYWAMEYEGLKPGCGSAASVIKLRNKNLKKMKQNKPESRNTTDMTSDNTPTIPSTTGQPVLSPSNKNLTDLRIAFRLKKLEAEKENLAKELTNAKKITDTNQRNSKETYISERIKEINEKLAILDRHSLSVS